jgi:hypothetical protein
MNCDIFIRSYYKDFRWLKYCLRSIDKYCNGFRDLILVVPESSIERLDSMGLTQAKILLCRDYPDDYLGQQVTKLMADTFTDADVICHVDSDCIFHRQMNPSDLFDNGRLEMVMTPYTHLPKCVPWQNITQRLLKRDVAYEFMRRQPQAFPRWLYRELRDYVQAVHGKDIESYVTGQPYRGFSEYNALGAFAYYFHRNQFTWFDTSKRKPEEPLCKWYWSWGGINPTIKQEITTILE